tara:strand:+ start:7789 stop:8922 length:1134 start_codon:yes stop_codon:yes gene_type:complete
MLTESIRDRDFPRLRDRSYLNTAAEGILPIQSKEALANYAADKDLGMEGRPLLFAEMDRCRESAGDLLGLSREEVSFCSSTSEAYNLLATAIEFGEHGEVVVTDLDFPAGATPWLQLPAHPSVCLWKNRDGILELDELDALLNENTKLVQVSLVSFLTGYRIPWAHFRDLVREKAPQAILAVDVTQAAGRVDLDCLDADCLFASSYKWLLGSHGSCVVAVPRHARDRIIVRAGGWYHLANAFDADRFSRAEPFPGAPGFAVGMPAFPAIYALRSGIDLIRETGARRIAEHADPLVARIHEGLAELGFETMSPPQPGNSSGIISFQTTADAALSDFLLSKNIHVMHQAGRIRISIHGYNTEEDIDRCLEALKDFRKTN